MTVILDAPANEEGTYPIDFSFPDPVTGALLIPDSITWSLTDSENKIVNGRDNVDLPPAATVTITLTGADLALPNPASTVRIVTMTALIDSSLGNNLPVNEEFQFNITNLRHLPKG